MNIASNEDSSFDMTGRWISNDLCRITFHLSEDGMGECEIDYNFDRYDLVFLKEIIESFLESQPKE